MNTKKEVIVNEKGLFKDSSHGLDLVKGKIMQFKDLSEKDLIEIENSIITIQYNAIIMISEIEDYVNVLTTNSKLNKLRGYKKELFYFIYYIIKHLLRSEYLDKSIIIFHYQYTCILKFCDNNNYNYMINLNTKQLLVHDSKTIINYKDIFYDGAKKALDQLVLFHDKVTETQIVVDVTEECKNLVVEIDNLTTRKKEINIEFDTKLNNILKNTNESDKLEEEIKQKYDLFLKSTKNNLNFDYDLNKGKMNK